MHINDLMYSMYALVIMCLQEDYCGGLVYANIAFCSDIKFSIK